MKLLQLSLFVIFLSLTLFAIQACQSSGQCPHGFCQANQCVDPQVSEYMALGPCNTTSQCIEGYCASAYSQCIVPKGGAFVLGFGIRSGCEGLTTCREGIFCLIFCYLVWVLLFALAGYAAYLRRKARVLFPLLIFVFPVLIALFTLPVLGLIFALLEVVFLIYQGRPKEEEAEEEEVEQ